MGETHGRASLLATSLIDRTAHSGRNGLIIIEGGTRTEVTPRISFKAFLMSAMSASSSNVIINCAGLGTDVAISLSFNNPLLQKYEITLGLAITLFVFYSNSLVHDQFSIHHH